MRIWSLHPRYLDPQGLVALWRETLLAQAVLRGETKGYKNHPQLDRFKAHATPILAINSYLAGIFSEATIRGYSFNRSKIGSTRSGIKITVTKGQMDFEWDHLQRKLAQRSPEIFARLRNDTPVECHPLFTVRSGPIADWERPIAATPT